MEQLEKHRRRRTISHLPPINRCFYFLLLFSLLFGLYHLLGFYNSISCPSKTMTSATPSSSSSSSSSSEHGIKLSPDTCSSLPPNNPFDEIYLRGTWGSKLHTDPEYYYHQAIYPPPMRQSASGMGSDLGHFTQNSLAILKRAIVQYNVSSMVDVPCGDVNWIFDSYVTDSIPVYLGLDVSSLVVESNRRRFGHHRNKWFRVWDAVVCGLPRFINVTHNYDDDTIDDGYRHHHHRSSLGEGKTEVESSAIAMESQPFDLIHVRDVIQHMPLKQGIKFICNVFHSGAKVFVTTSFNDQEFNGHIANGDMYRNNLFASPFDFPLEEKEGCERTHLLERDEGDYTCVFDLGRDWVRGWVEKKCKRKKWNLFDF